MIFYSAIGSLPYLKKIQQHCILVSESSDIAVTSYLATTVYDTSDVEKRKVISKGTLKFS